MLVGMLIAELQQLDPDMPIYCAGHAEFTVEGHAEIGSVEDGSPQGAIIAVHSEDSESVIRVHYDLQPCGQQPDKRDPKHQAAQ